MVTCDLVSVSRMYVIDICYGVSQLLCKVRERRGADKCGIDKRVGPM
jgi:hypothetical protein